ncbi:MAG: acetyltransferase [Planctomycetaceae bacterium]|nr:acetyltransferase [Planctomycetaceae bacterium]
MEPLVIVGAGGFGREVFDLVQDINRERPTWDVLGFVDDNTGALAGYTDFPPVLGAIDYQCRWGSAKMVCAVGSPCIRRRLVERLDKHGARWATLIHPTAHVGTGSILGEGCVLCIRAIVTANVRLGRHVHINCTASAGHDACIGDFCTLSSHVDICGHAVIGEGVLLGSHAAVLPSVHVGNWACVGVSSAAIRDVRPETTVLGVPAKEIFARSPLRQAG